MSEDPVWRCPPFPAPPPGVQIVPFVAFVPSGYRRVGDVEVDAGMGIRTVKVLNEQEAALKRKAKKKMRNAGNGVDAAGRLIPWWEEWEEGEGLRATSESLDRIPCLQDRVCLAADDFRVGRTWPEIAQGVRNMWDQFRLYIGLISSIPVYKRVKNRPKGQVDGPNNAEEASDEEEEGPRAKRTKVVIVQDYLEQTALPGKQLEPSSDKSTQRLHAFIDDMEKSVKVFLSSYMRDKGLIWAERNLFIAPTVLHFFLRFMLRNGVFADSDQHLDNLKRAVAIAAAAQKELPLTAKLGQILPGQFDLACKECWGTQGTTSVHISATLPPSAPSPTPSSDGSAFETELQQHAVEVVPSDVVLDSITARQVMEDTLDTEHAPVTTIPVSGDPWTAAVDAEAYTTASWTDVSIPWLMPLLGPTTLPLHLTPGLVECSTRRVDGMSPPCERGDGVEAVLSMRFWSVLVRPWVCTEEEATLEFPRPEVFGSQDGWDPYRDDLTILVDAETAGHLVPGMGLCATWVQMVPEHGERHPGACFWYVENLAASFPSYYMEGETIEEDEEDEDL